MAEPTSRAPVTENQRGPDPLSDPDHQSSTDPLLDDAPGDWVPDVLTGFQRRTLALPEDDLGPRVCTLVRPRPTDAPQADPDAVPVLILHGWADYFYNHALAVALQAGGYAVYALDFHRYGRSMREGDTPGWTDSLDAYDADLEAALGVIGELHPHRPVLLAHSTGGLTASWWAHRHPGRVRALVLNSPWLDMKGSAWVRTLAQAIVQPLASRDRLRMLRLPRFDLYWRTLSAQADGEWELHSRWRPRFSFEVPAAWLTAVLAVQAEVAGGLDVQEPVLCVVAGSGTRTTRYAAALAEADIVLDPAAMAQQALRLGSRITVHRVAGAMHDVFASRASVREPALAETLRWLSLYAPPASAD
ncbi:MAG: alpha/beta hydrolase [Micrococcus sp.]|nr:alpha/beta hydrolase [Micrococcus sp.]